MDQLWSSKGTPNGSILIMHKDLNASAFLNAYLKDQGFNVKTAYSGAEAVSYVRASQPDAIIMDAVTPYTKGGETMSMIRSYSDAPVVLLAPTTQELSIAPQVQPGNNFMQFPFYPDELFNQLGAILGRRHGAQPGLNTAKTSQRTPVTEPLVSIVIPAYNEEQGLPRVLEAVNRVVDETYEVLVIDDGSSDGTASAALGYPCRLIQHPHNRGKGAALRTGIQQARGKSVIFIDADNTYPAQAIPKLAELLQKHDMARGVRSFDRKNIGFINRIGNVVFDAIVNCTHLVEGGDILSGMYGGQRDKLMALELNSEGFDIEAEICVKAKAHNFSCATLPIQYAKRIGETKLHVLRDGYRILKRIISLSVSLSPINAEIKQALQPSVPMHLFTPKEDQRLSQELP